MKILHTYCCETPKQEQRAFSISRRGFVQGLLASAGVGMSDISFANVATPTDARFVLIVLRGGMDGLNVVVPYADRYYKTARQDLAYNRPNETHRSTIDLDGYFGLNPALKSLQGMYTDGDLSFVHATSTPYRSRSHFDGQDMFENGSNMASGGPNDGWLNRVLSVMHARHNMGVSMGRTTPYVMQGDARFLSLNPGLELNNINPDILLRIQGLYTGNDTPIYSGGDIRTAFDQALESSDLLKVLGADKFQRMDRMKQLAEMAGETLAMPQGARIATMSIGGWDTHADQDILLTENLENLAGVLLALKSSLGSAWDNTTIACVSEFGRMAYANGTDGTDHGTAGCAILAGGAVQGNKVYGKWPTLNPDALFEGRDVYPTSDVRCVLAEILHVKFGLSKYDLETKIFPSMSYAPQGIVV